MGPSASVSTVEVDPSGIAASTLSARPTSNTGARKVVAELSDRQVDPAHLQPVGAGMTERDPHGLALNTPGAKGDAGKPRAALCLFAFLPALSELLPAYSTPLGVLRTAVSKWPLALEAVSEVTTVGAAKYTPNGWREVPDAANRYYDAYGRHLLARGRGEVVDDGQGGTGCRHDAQCVWNLLAALSVAQGADIEVVISRAELVRLLQDELQTLEMSIKAASSKYTLLDGLVDGEGVD